MFFLPYIFKKTKEKKDNSSHMTIILSIATLCPLEKILREGICFCYVFTLLSCGTDIHNYKIY